MILVTRRVNVEESLIKEINSGSVSGVKVVVVPQEERRRIRRYLQVRL